MDITSIHGYPANVNRWVDLLIAMLPGAPIVTVNSAARLIDRSFERTDQAVARSWTVPNLRKVSVSAIQ